MSQTEQMVPAMKKKFWWWTIITIAVYFIMRWKSGGLDGSVIVALEMAKIPERVAQVMQGVNPEAFKWSTYIDFLFLTCYSFMLFYGSRWLGYLSGQYILRKAGNFFSILAFLAGLADVLENAGLLHTLNKGAEAWVVHSTYDMAVTKFSLLFIVVLFCTVSVFFWGIEQMQGENR